MKSLELKSNSSLFTHNSSATIFFEDMSGRFGEGFLIYQIYQSLSLIGIKNYSVL
jgi:hypothetical protein